jgi:hypothetical protein
MRIGPEPATDESSESRSISDRRIPIVRIDYRSFSSASRQAMLVSLRRQKFAGAAPRRGFGKDTLLRVFFAPGVVQPCEGLACPRSLLPIG